MNTIRVALFAITLQLLAAFAGAATIDTTEYQIKAAYLYKFASYVEWPPAAFAQPGDPFTIGIIGADDIAMALDDLKVEHLIDNRRIEIKLLKPGDPVTNIQMLFVGQQESAHLKRLLEPVQVQPVLVITESEQALGTGSMINFILVEERVRFEISVPHAERSGLKISARLLAVAQNIETGTKP